MARSITAGLKRRVISSLGFVTVPTSRCKWHRARHAAWQDEFDGARRGRRKIRESPRSRRHGIHHHELSNRIWI
jgi:hypothetical protein